MFFHSILAVLSLLSQSEEIKENCLNQNLHSSFLDTTGEVGGMEVGVHFPPISCVSERLHCCVIR